MFRFALATLLVLILSTSPALAAAHLDGTSEYELEYAYTRVVAAFYEPVHGQAVMHGIRERIEHLLSFAGVRSPVVSEPKATGDVFIDPRHLFTAVDAAYGRYASVVSSNAIVEAALSGMLASLNDPYTAYLSRSTFAEMQRSLNDADTYGGVGVILSADGANHTFRIREVYDGGPADRAGVHAGDLLVAVNGMPTKQLGIERVLSKVRGKIGVPVSLRLFRRGQNFTLSIVREHVAEPSATYKMIGDRIGYVHLSVFGNHSADEFAAATKKLAAQGAKALVLDLRGNGGGYVQTAVDICSQLLGADETIVSIHGRDGLDEVDHARASSDARVPLAVLVDHDTASASEITAGAIQDNRAGFIVGTRTYGKGVVQVVYTLPDGSGMKITEARYLTPAGRDINGAGIEPDVVVRESADARLGTPGQDAQLDAAMDVLHLETGVQ